MPTTSVSFSTKRGSLESLNLRTRWGLSPFSRQTRFTVSGLTPTASAHRAAAPMSGARRRAVQRLLHDPMDRGGRDRRLTSPAGGHLAQPEHALLGEALPPEQDGGPRRLQLCRDCVIRAAFGGEQNDACPE